MAYKVAKSAQKPKHNFAYKLFPGNDLRGFYRLDNGSEWLKATPSREGITRGPDMLDCHVLRWFTEIEIPTFGVRT